MAEIDVLKAQIVRQDYNTPWGFRLEGGADYGQPLKIQRITPGSPAARIGLKARDEVTEIGDCPTEGLTSQDAHELITQYGLSLILTVERRAFGAVPTNPVMNPNQSAPVMPYQTYDMTGAVPRQRHQPYSNVEFRTVQAKPYEAPPQRPYEQYAPPAPEPEVYYPAQAPPQHQHQVQPQSPTQQMQPYHPGYHVPEEDRVPESASQSRTFKVLESLMSNEEPYSGPGELPPMRSASVEKWRQEQDMKKQGSQQRLKVFVPQEYNSPMGLYSAHNIVETFADQAEVQMQEIESRQDDPVSGAQRAVFEDQYGGAR